MQALSWQTGDRYSTQDGTVMEIIANKVDDHLTCIERNESGRTYGHGFDMQGNMLCDCTHGNLMHRIIGSVQSR